jgi:hypothetical protein
MIPDFRHPHNPIT